jgi:hypothetical protein
MDNGMNNGWFAIADFDEEKGLVKHIFYNGTSLQAVRRMYPNCDFSGPWDTEAEALAALGKLIAENSEVRFERG